MPPSIKKFFRFRSRPRNLNTYHRHSRWGRWIVRGLMVGLVAAVLILGLYAYWASTFDLEAAKRMKERTTIHDMDGNVWARLQGENRIPVELKAVSKNFIACVLAREDTRFFSHSGIDFRGMARAVVRNIQGFRQGASTLTQQMVRNSYGDDIGHARNLHRKLLEIAVAIRMERNFSKPEILEMYGNRIYFGAGVYGIEMASKVYFNKTAAQLSLSEAAMIAGIIRAPTTLSPFNNPKRAIAERDSVLRRLAGPELAAIRATYSISAAEIEAAAGETLKFAKKQKISTQDNYAMDTIVRDFTVLIDEEQQTRGGLKIFTTIDPQMQKDAERILEENLAKVEASAGYAHPKRVQFTEEMRKSAAPTPYLQGALMVLDNDMGGVRAIVGGRDYHESTYNRALDAKRQIGSTFKPFVYAAAYARGLKPDTLINDDSIALGEIVQAPHWTPDNSDGTYKGYQPAEEGLVMSRNTMTARVGEYLGGPIEVQKVAKAVGLEEMPAIPSAYIGTFGASLMDLTLAFSIFPNLGMKNQVYIIERIESAKGEVLYRASHHQLPVLSKVVCSKINSALTQVMDRGTAARSHSLGWNRIGAGKTGTTDNYYDAWFVGYTSSLTCGVWVGLDKPATIITRGYGSAVALPIWVELMQKAPGKRYPAVEFGSAPVSAKRPSATKTEGGVFRSFKRFFGGD